MSSASLFAKPDTALSLVGMNTVRCADMLADLSAIEHNDIFDVVIADPPYNIGKDFGNDSDCRTLSDYVVWCDAWLRQCLRLSKPSAPVYVYGFPEVLAHIAVRQPLEKQRWLVWHYTNKTVPSLKFWQRSHESILCLWKGARPTIDIDAVREQYTEAFIKNAAGKVRKETHCRYSSKGVKTIYQAHPKGALPRDVIKVPALAGGAGYRERWFYCDTCGRLGGPNEAEAHRTHEVVRHPTQKPLMLSRKLISSAAPAGGDLLIPFAGSGSECVTAKTWGLIFTRRKLIPIMCGWPMPGCLIRSRGYERQKNLINFCPELTCLCIEKNTGILNWWSWICRDRYRQFAIYTGNIGKNDRTFPIMKISMRCTRVDTMFSKETC